MGKKLSFKSTIIACYAGYITQAAVNNLAPILFVIFQQKYSLSYEMLSVLIILNFFTQLLVDAVSVRLCRYVSPRTLTVFAHIMCGAGLVLLGVFPLLLPRPFFGLAAAVMIYAVGGGLTEVLISPIIEAIPDTVGSEKAAAMSLLHSFYCWGQVAVVLLSTGFIFLFSDEHWYILPLVWAVLPMINAVVFTRVPVALQKSGHEALSVFSLLKTKGFSLILVMMFCAGACELTMSQWSSLFAQRGLMISKALGDLLGPCLFAVLMGLGRVLYSVFADKVNLYKIMALSGLLCVACYITAALSDNAVLSLAACALCGLSVAVMWPGTYSLAAARIKNGGTGMFSIMSLLGDFGFGAGPFVAGMICDKVTSVGLSEAAGMKTGFGFSVVFPTVLIVSSVILLFIFAKKSKTE